MSENPYEAGVEYGSHDTSMPSGARSSVRPWAVTIFGFLNLLFGVLTFIGIATSLSSWRTTVAAFQSGEPSQDFGSTLFMVSFFISLVSGGLLLTSGVGLLRMREYGRRYAIIFAWLAISSRLLIIFLQFVFFYGELSSRLPASQRMGVTVFVVLIGLASKLTYPVLLLIFMNTVSVRAALSSHAPT